MNNQEWLSSTLTRMEERQISQAELLATLNALMGEHVRRTDTLERELKPVKEHVSFMSRLGKVVLGLGSVSAALHSIGLF